MGFRTQMKGTAQNKAGWGGGVSWIERATHSSRSLGVSLCNPIVANNVYLPILAITALSYGFCL